jgi:hypothetical protein
MIKNFLCNRMKVVLRFERIVRKRHRLAGSKEAWRSLPEEAMSYFGISQIGVDDAGRVMDVKIHSGLNWNHDTNLIGWSAGDAKDYAAVANLIVHGHTVFVLLADKDGVFHHTDHVRIAPNSGPFEYLESYDENGHATTSLLELPRFG